MFSPSPTPIPHRQNLNRFNIQYENIGFSWINVLQIILFGFGLLILIWLMLLYLCNQVNYVPFNTNLTLFKKKSDVIFPKLCSYWFVLQALVLCEYPEEFFIMFFLHYYPNFTSFGNLDPNDCKPFSRVCFHTSCLFIFTHAISPPALILSLIVFQIWCQALCRNIPSWLPLILILMANDIERNPGPSLQNQFLTFMNWNLNSLVKEILDVLASSNPTIIFWAMT